MTKYSTAKWVTLDVLEEVAVGNENSGVTAGLSAMRETGLDNGELAGLC